MREEKEDTLDKVVKILEENKVEEETEQPIEEEPQTQTKPQATTRYNYLGVLEIPKINLKSASMSFEIAVGYIFE